MPAISVIIPTHDRPRLLPRAVESAASAGTDVEVIVVDDASVDETAAVCRELPGIRYIRMDRNQGVAGARNVGLIASEGKYVAFLDDDDLRLPGSLDLQASALEANPDAGFVCGATIMAEQDYRETGETIKPRQQSGDVFWDILELDFPVMPLGTLIRKECFFRTGLLKKALNGIDDWDIFTRIAELYPVIIIDQPVGIYRQPTASSGQGSSARATQLRRAARHQLELLKLPRVQAVTLNEQRRIRRRTINRIADSLLWNAAQRLPHGEFDLVWTNTATALRLNPLRAIRPRAYARLMSRIVQASKTPAP